MISRRVFLGALGALGLINSTSARPRSAPESGLDLPFGLDEGHEFNSRPFVFGRDGSSQSPHGPYGSGEGWYVGTIPDQPFPIPVVDPGLVHPRWRPQTVSFSGPEPEGTIVIRPQERFLYLVQADRTARRYGIGVGRQGFAWSGTAQVKRKAKWPSLRPPAEMLRRRPDLPESMEGGWDNPLGARALYLYQADRDTLYRIHGTNEPDTIGQAVSSGCIRLLNEDIYDLYNRVPVGTVVNVEAGGQRGRIEDEENWDEKAF